MTALGISVADDEMPDANALPAPARGGPVPRSGLRAWGEALAEAGLRLYETPEGAGCVVAGLPLAEAWSGEGGLPGAADRASAMLHAAGWPHDRADIRVHAVVPRRPPG